MAFSVQECTLSRSSNTGLDGIRKEPDFWRAASVPDAWWRRRQRGTEWEQERQLQARPVHSRGRGHAPLASKGHTTAPQDQVMRLNSVGHYCDHRSGTRGGPSICGGASRLISSSNTLQSGVSDDQSKLSKLMPPRCFAERRAHTTKLFDFLMNCSRSAPMRRAPFFRTSFAATRCCSARNCISVSAAYVNFSRSRCWPSCQNASR
jgi:hypothetical protein